MGLRGVSIETIVAAGQAMEMARDSATVVSAVGSLRVLRWER